MPSLEHLQRALLYAAFARVEVGGDAPIPLQHQQEIVAMLSGNSTAAAAVPTGEAQLANPEVAVVTETERGRQEELNEEHDDSDYTATTGT